MKRIKKTFSNSKKGNAIIDTIFLLSFLLLFIVVIYSMNLIVDDVNEDIQDDDDSSNTSKAIIQDYADDYETIWDNVFLFVFVMGWAILLLSSYLVDSHPVFFVITLIIMILVFVFAVYLGNSYEEIVVEDDDFSSLVPNYPKAHFIMSNLLIVAIVIGFSIMLVLFGKNRMGT